VKAKRVGENFAQTFDDGHADNAQRKKKDDCQEHCNIME
jgi:hypothetical protein